MTTQDGGCTRRTGGPLSRALLTVMLALAAGACFASGSGRGGNVSYTDNPVTVEVKNQSWSTVHVYLLTGGQYSSLGQLTSQNTEQYEVTARMMSGRHEVRLAADPVGSNQGFISDPIVVNPGDLVSWTLTEPLSHSSVMVR